MFWSGPSWHFFHVVSTWKLSLRDSIYKPKYNKTTAPAKKKSEPEGKKKKKSQRRRKEAEEEKRSRNKLDPPKPRRAPGCVSPRPYELFLSLWFDLIWSDLVFLSLIWSDSFSLSLIWSDLVRWGRAWDLKLFKIFLVYKSSLKDSIFKWSPCEKRCHIICD